MTRWFTQYRQTWISNRLRVFGNIRRRDIEKKFWVSAQQASLDLRLYQQAHQGNLAYNFHSKRYELVGDARNAAR